MSRLEAWLHHLANVLVGGTGIAYAFFLYCVRSEDPYAVVHHPLQPLVQHWHVLLAPALVFSTGALWKRHALERWRSGAAPRRRSGLLLLFSFAPMAISGYAIQVAVDEAWRQAWVLAHGTASALWVAAYLVHQWARRLKAPLPAGSADPRPRAG
ncbi:MAG: hypothetical protein EYC70_06265 [Planctomycetota bacterium]|nr:MAG: hypothetical protein EYC70_06265 [Planctomycetota bacterium]